MNTRAAFTICSWNYFAYATILLESFKKHHQDINLYIFIADRPQSAGLPPFCRDAVIVVDDAVVPPYELMASSYSIMEYNTSIKAHCFDYVFDKIGAKSAIYLDPDIVVTGSLGHIYEVIDQGSDCVVTPHITEPLSDGKYPGDLAIAQAGVYNLGFIGFGDKEPARRFLAWWRKWLETDCIVDLERGIFVDQKFCEFVPAFIEHTYILRDPGYNLAYWNLCQRPIEARDDKLFSGSSLVRFVHFSGVNKDKPEEFSKHQNRFTRETIGALQPLFDAYVEALRRNDVHGSTRFSKLSYGFGFMRDGTPVVDGMRRCFRRYAAEIPSGQSPFELDESFFKQPSERLPGTGEADGGEPVSRLIAETYLSRIDLRRAFDAWTTTGRGQLKQWAKSSFPKEYGLAPEWAECLWDAPAPPPAAPAANVFNVAGKALSAVRGLVRRSLATTREEKSSTPPVVRREHGLAIYGFFHTETGLGQAARAISSAFATSGIPSSRHTFRAPGCKNDIEWDTSSTLENRFDAALLAINADNVMYLDHLMNPELIKANRTAGLFYWELPVFPGMWAKAFDAIEEVWVSSTFTANSMRSTTQKNIRVLPVPVPLNDMDQKEARSALGLPSDRLIYLATFDFNSFPERKNPLGVIRAFVDAFPSDTESSPLLVVKCHGAHNRGAYSDELSAVVARSRNIMLVDKVYSQIEMLQLQAAADIYVSLHRSEGFGLNLAEAMAAGKLVIATNFSGNVDFTKQDNSLLVDFDMRQVRDGEYVAWQGQWWADPRHDEAVSVLRLAESQPGLRARLGEAAKKFVASELSSERIGATMARYVDELGSSGG
jgi:glycosyltransferase involved in cell wall biosynthesis